MSFYLGKDNNGISVMHLVGSKVSKEELKTGPIPSTIFHSNLKYIRYELFECVKASSLVFEAPQSYIDDFVTTNVYMIVIDNVIVPSVYVRPDDHMGGFVTFIRFYKSVAWNYPTDYGSIIPSNKSKYIHFDSRVYNNISSVKFLRLSLSSDGNFIPPPEYDNNKGILIDNGQINVNGVDLAGLKYLSIGVINNTDDVYSVPNSPVSIQAVNSSISNSLSLSFDSQSSSIYKGDNKIFSYANREKSYMYSSKELKRVPLNTYSLFITGYPTTATYNIGMKGSLDLITMLLIKQEYYDGTYYNVYVVYPGGPKVTIAGTGGGYFDMQIQLSINGDIQLVLSSDGGYWGHNRGNYPFEITKIVFY